MNVVYSEVRGVASAYALVIATNLKASCILVQIVVPDTIPNPSVFLCGWTVQRLSTRGCCASEEG